MECIFNTTGMIGIFSEFKNEEKVLGEVGSIEPKKLMVIFQNKSVIYKVSFLYKGQF